jgi:hypothetical protein
MEPVTSRQITTILNAWKKEVRVEIDAKTVIQRLTDEFGEPMNGKEWPVIMVFGSDEAVAEWDGKLAAQ